MSGGALERAGQPVSLLEVRTKDTKLVADPTLVARALANLLANGASHGDGVRALVVRDGDGGLVFPSGLEDRGPGFAAGEEARVFESFYQRPGSETRDRGALGLGLTLVRRIAVAHGGRAFAENREGGGGRVGILLPRDRKKR